MTLDLLTAISPIDGRYRGKTESLADYFSEYALIRYRVRVEIEYFITLCELPLPQLASFDHALFPQLRSIYADFNEEGAQRVKDIEKVTNHDVKAVEYFIKEQFDKIGGLDAYKEFIHFGLTSQDINNTSVPLSMKEALENVYCPLVEELIAQLQQYADEWKDEEGKANDERLRETLHLLQSFKTTCTRHPSSAPSIRASRQCRHPPSGRHRPAA